jgi:O-antigen/teichoic acid export membrane protein
MKSHAEEKRIRPDILTAAVYIAAALMMAFGLVTHRIIGDKGAFFVAFPMSVYLFFYTFLVLSVQKAVYIMVRLRARRSQYLNAEANMVRSLRIFAAIGAASALLLMGLAYTIAGRVLGAQRGFIQIMIAGCAVLFMGIQGVYRGYLQGVGFTRPILFSDLLVALVSFITGTVLSAVFYGYGLKVNDLFHVDELSSVYGSVGMLAGTLVGIIVGFIQIIISYSIRKNEIAEFAKTGAPRYLDNKNDVLVGIRPILLLYASPAFMMIVDQCFYCIFMSRAHADVDYKTIFGIYSGRIVALTVFLAVVCYVPFIKPMNRVMARFERDEYEGARERFRSLVRHANMFFMPVSVFVFAVNDTLMVALFSKSSAMISTLIMIGAMFVYLCCFAIVLSWLINHMGKSVASMLNIGIAWAVHIVCLVVFVAVLNLSAYGLLLSAIVPFLVYDVLCLMEISKVLTHRQEFFRSFLLPFAASAIAGLVVFLLNRFFVNLIGDILTVVLCAVIYWFIYMIAMLVIRGIRAHELTRIPMGGIFLGIAYMIQSEESNEG